MKFHKKCFSQFRMAPSPEQWCVVTHVQIQLHRFSKFLEGVAPAVHILCMVSAWRVLVEVFSCLNIAEGHRAAGWILSSVFNAFHHCLLDHI